MSNALDDILTERARQDAKWGEQVAWAAGIFGYSDLVVEKSLGT